MELAQNMPGKIIMLDGPDGVGKSEQIRLAEEALRQQNRQVYTTRAHGGTPMGEKLREVSLSDTPRNPYTDLHISRAIHAELAKDLHERKAAGFVCLVDRSPAAMWAYQVRASKLPAEYALPSIKEDFAMFAPDLVIVYEAALSTLKNRIAGRTDKPTDFFESKPDEFHEWVIVGYAETAKLFGAILIDASSDMRTVHQRTMAVMQPVVENTNV